MIMKKTYIRPTLAVFKFTASSCLMASVYINKTSEGSDQMDTRKKDNTDMWGNDNSKGIWD